MSNEYLARCWRTEHLKKCAEKDLEIMMYGLLGDKKIDLEHGEFEVPGFPSATPHRVRVSVNGAVQATAYTLAGAYAHLIALMLDGAWHPLT